MLAHGDETDLEIYSAVLFDSRFSEFSRRAESDHVDGLAIQASSISALQWLRASFPCVFFGGVEQALHYPDTTRIDMFCVLDYLESSISVSPDALAAGMTL